jgi:hypothetical protein
VLLFSLVEHGSAKVPNHSIVIKLKFLPGEFLIRELLRGELVHGTISVHRPSNERPVEHVVPFLTLSLVRVVMIKRDILSVLRFQAGPIFRSTRLP